MRYLISGGTGSLGNALTPKLLERGDDVVIYSRDELKQAEMAERYPKAEFMLGDVRDRTRLVQALKGVEVVIHAAALKRVDSVARNPSEVIKTNVQGTMNVVDVAGHRKVILISTDKACVDFHAPVALVDRAPCPISTIVTRRDSCLVWSLTEYGLRPARVTGWYKNKLSGRDMIGVSYEHGARRRGRIQKAWVTEDHPVLTTDGWMMAGLLGPEHKLITADLVPVGPLMGMLIGCLLGDACGNTRLKFGHAEKEIEWLNIIHAALSAFNPSSISIRRSKLLSRQKFFSFEIRANAFTRWLRTKFYPDEKKLVPRDLVEQNWCPQLLASWFLDDGCLTDGKYARIATHGFTADDVEWLASWLTLHGMSAYRYVVKIGGRDYSEISLTAEGSFRLFEIIGSFIPNTMRKKVPSWAASYDSSRWQIQESFNQFTASPRIERFKATPDARRGRRLGIRTPQRHSKTKRSVYCLSVEGTENFIVNGIVLHNCQPTNIYGASKMLAEQYTVNCGKSVVRYGNVLGSRGSFVHIFKKAAYANKPIPVTDSSCTRFIITLSQAADFVLQMVEKLKGGEIIVPKIKSVRVLDVAECYSERVTTIKMRHGGEKIHELLIAPHEKNTVMLWDGKSMWAHGVYESNQNDFYSREEIKSLLEAEHLL